MPTILRQGPYSIAFFAGDRPEPKHVHVRRDRNEAKIWLEPVEVANDGGFGSTEINRITQIIETHADMLKDAWDDYFAS